MLRVLAAALAGLGVYVFWREQNGAPGRVEPGQVAGDLYETAGDVLTSAATSAADFVGGLMGMGYSPDKIPLQYRDAIRAAEQANGLPAGLLGRLLWQESRYRPEIIDGRVRSSVGAMGIAQFMPATAAGFGIDPLDPFQAIPAAAAYLARNFRRFGNWAEAIAAYNWGEGNVQRKGLANAPAETRTYYSSIMKDTGLA